MIVMTDWMAARMISLGWIQQLDASKIPNCTPNLIEPLRNRSGTRTWNATSPGRAA